MDGRGVAVVIEDDEDIRELLAVLLTQSGFTVTTAATGSEGVRAVRDLDPVIVTVDLGLPDIDGFEVTRRVRKDTDAYIMMLTARTEEVDTLMGLDAGADDYITKPFRPRELRARVEAMLRRPRHPTVDGGSPGGRHSGPASAPTPAQLDGVVGTTWELDGLSLTPELYHVTVEGREVSLTPTEFILLRTLLVAGRLVRSKADLFRVLRDEEPASGTYVSEADERTVEVHMGNLRRKLGDDPRTPRWIETLRGVGYRCVGSPRKAVRSA